MKYLSHSHFQSRCQWLDLAVFFPSTHGTLDDQEIRNTIKPNITSRDDDEFAENNNSFIGYDVDMRIAISPCKNYGKENYREEDTQQCNIDDECDLEVQDNGES